jgi:hypothetical protein
MTKSWQTGFLRPAAPAWADGAADRQWRGFGYTGEASNVVRFQNQGSGRCLTTDGVPGHWVDQQPCDSANGRQAWRRSFVWFYSGYTPYNPATGLNLDVQGNGHANRLHEMKGYGHNRNR